ncbi:MAG: DUF547 domain-containing protein [Candidatus Omnitrophica bacterium]|nr:DUF547 domain-containing protein [Candidatus Omnitrophota bacterium]MCB9746928.1 DUF547 domain-containing protein [Candidatus Omnitrophota bacterium]
MRKIIYCLCLCLIVLACSGEDAQTQNDASSREEINYSLWDNVLKTYVNEQGRVDYEGLLKDRHKFDQFIAQVEKVNISTFTPQEQKAFWINAYNAITMKVIVDNYPVKGIRTINFGLVWNVGRNVAGGKKSLSDIEHKILRLLGDPRIHFAINCASIGCPRLLNKPFYPETLDEQLDREAVRFINDPEKIKLDRATNTLFYSAILDWFEEDFLVVESDILSYIKRYINKEDRDYISSHEIMLKVTKYDWGLNKQ